MEYLTGQMLGQIIHQWGPFAPRESLSILHRVAEALIGLGMISPLIGIGIVPGAMTGGGLVRLLTKEGKERTLLA